MFKNFEKILIHPNSSDEQIETFFKLLKPKKRIAAINFVRQYRPELATKLEAEIEPN